MIDVAQEQSQLLSIRHQESNKSHNTLFFKLLYFKDHILRQELWQLLEQEKNTEFVLTPPPPHPRGPNPPRKYTIGKHNVKIYTQSTTMSVPTSELGPPTPSPASECAPARNQRGGATSPTGEEVGGSQLGRLEKKPYTLSICEEKLLV